MKFYDSFEAEKLKQLIRKKKEYLATISGKTSYQFVQKEITFLQNEILPIVLNNTNIIHSEVAKSATLAFESALTHKVNGLLFFIPIDENYTDNPVVGIYNPKAHYKFGTPGAVEVFCEIINMDGNEAQFKTFNLPINEL